MQLTVLAATERWAVVDKPTGLPVHRSALVDERRTLMRFVRRQLGPNVSPVHRLDRATSGCLLLSLDPAYTSVLQDALGQGEKRYVAMVRGKVASFDPIRFSNPMKDPDGVEKDAVTLLQPLATAAEPRSSLVLATPLTGRYHQIRRHLRDLSHPIVGDSSHGDSRVNRWWRDEQALGRLALHCLSLRLDLPDGEVLSATCPVPDDLYGVWARQPWWDAAVAALPELAQRSTQGVA